MSIDLRLLKEKDIITHLKEHVKQAVFLVVILALVASTATAQLTPSSSVVSVTVENEQDRYLPGSSSRVLVKLDIDEGWHSQSHTPSQESLIATVLKLAAPTGITTGRVIYPEGKMVKFEFSDVALSSYEGTAYLGASFTVSPDMTPGEYVIAGALTIQTCNDKNCLVPSEIEITIPVSVVAVGETVKKINEKLFADNESIFNKKPSHMSGGGIAGMGDSGIGDYLTENGLLLTYVLIFLGGLALNLTPCVYPLIPITVSYFGGKSESKRGHLLIHALFYLFGMATMYSALGLVAALTGGLFGALLQSPVVIILIAVILIGLALSMFGAYEIIIPASLTSIGGKNREGFFGTFMMGLTVGIIAAPCIGPFVLGLLTFVGEKQDPLLGFTMFFVLAIGLGIPFVFLAIFSGSVSKLPRSGAWMVWVKQVFGVILIAMAIYFLQPLIPDAIYTYLLGLFLALSGIYLAIFTGVKAVSSGFKVIKGVVGAIFVGAGVLLTAMTFAPERPAIEWVDGNLPSIESALKSDKPVIIDFTAEWCVPCKELEHFTFTDQRVVALAKNFTMIKIDLTKTDDPEASAVKDHYSIAGVPTVLFFDATGKNRGDLSFAGFIDADAFLDKMEKVATPAGG